METVEFGRLTAHHRRELEGAELDPFDSAGITLRYRPKEQHIALQDESGALVASTGMLIVDVEVEGVGFPVVGFGGVIVRASHRGRGLGREIVQAAVARACTLGPAFAMLFCHDDRAGLYRKLGFVDVGGVVLVEQPDGIATMPQRTMWLALRPGATWPPGGLVVNSLPF